MIRIYLAVFMAVTLTSCNISSGKKKSFNDRGMIIPRNKSKSFIPQRPVGMVPIPGGSFVMGQTDYDFAQQRNASPKTVSVSGFFMDETEITNDMYHDFVNYVRDSIVRQRLAERANELGYSGGDNQGQTGIAEYAFKVRTNDNGDPSAYDQYINEMADGRSGYDSERQLNWDIPIIWDKYEYPDRDYVEVMESMYYPPEDRFNGERLIDVRKLNYVFTEIDKNKAAQYSKSGKTRKEFVTTNTINVYPDTTVWVRDFNYAYNDPLHQDYFWNTAYSKYPVVGVTWDQARGFCAYRTDKHRKYNQSRKSKSASDVIVYRLPTEVEWEYAARGGLQDAPYPWGGPYLMDSRGCYLANFKPKRGDYVEDCCSKSKKAGFIYTAPVKSFYPNDYGLYDMAGNVAEWTQSPYGTTSSEYTSTLNPYLGAGKENKKKTVKGGSWKDVGYLLMVANREYENKDSARSYIGFRTVQSIPEGADVNYRRIRK
ncbi:gliding motility lipoprotein GldK [Ornithobacterium rhinotracheale]|uniref:Gliding motility lipoprotein GldK n=1 Tax=Ornithobacterium rhinotracheale TaxID=28251 RepID=A0A410JQU5_ORNRH|nr:gliding motility lipoprotein GldK [Ornithobacterium rhinotracheale]QAR30519.1 gliding motility lipoprotein GldK [Ornithobacterium rhinotracheale]